MTSHDMWGYATRSLTHLDLFTGIGGVSLAAEWAGFEHVAFVECEPYCQAVLRKHWPEVPIIGDVHAVSAATVSELIDLLTGGPPCQPRSLAGRRRGTADDRDLWPEMRRVVAELKPRAVVVENPAGLLSLDHEAWCVDLEAEGYEVGTVVLPAAAVGAPHIRDRAFLLAYTERHDSERHRGSGGVASAARESEGCGEEWQRLRDATGNSGAALSNPEEYRRRQGRARRPDSGSTREREPQRALQDVADAEEQSVGAGLRTDDQTRIGRGRSGNGGSPHGDVPDTECAGLEERTGIGGNARTQQPAVERGRDTRCCHGDFTDSDGLSPLGSPESREERHARQSQSGVCRMDDGLSAGLDGDRLDPWVAEWPGVSRVAQGVPHRVDRLRALGNAVVPYQCYPILQAIADWMLAGQERTP